MSVCAVQGGFQSLPGLSGVNGSSRAGGVIRHFLLLTYLSTALLSMPVRLARLANGHGPLGRLPVGFRAKSTIFLASDDNKIEIRGNIK